MTARSLVPDVRNKVYFQVLTAQGDGDVEHLHFQKATLMLGDTVVLDDIKSINNGRSFFEFVPKSGAKGSY